MTKSMAKSSSRTATRSSSRSLPFKKTRLSILTKGLFDLSASWDGFLQSISIIFIIWIVYRTFFSFPVWFDEVVAKAVVFGLPTIIYARRCTGNSCVRIGLENERFWPGMFLGMFVGAIYGFVAVLRSMLRADQIQSVLLFASPIFWWTFFLAAMTAWWESVFFFGYVMNYLKDKLRTELSVVVITTAVFVLFHLPLRLLIGDPGMMNAILLLTVFAIGQGILYLRTKSLYAVALSHTLWGMVLLLYG